MPGFEASEVDGAEVVNLPRGPGRPTGQRKTGGRKPGSKNKRTRAGEQVLRPLVPGAKKRIKALLESDDPEIVLKVATMIFQYVFGRPTERRELSGPDGQAIETRATQILEASRRVSEAFTEVADTPDPGEVMTDESLGAVQSVNFLLAQREAAEHAQNPVRTSTPTVAVDAVPEPSSQPVESTLEPEVQGEPEAPPERHTLAFAETDFHIVGCPPDREGLPPVYELRSRSGGLVRRGPFDHVLDLMRKQAGGALGRWVLQEPRSSIEPSRLDQRSLSAPLPQVHRSRRQT